MAGSKYQSTSVSSATTSDWLVLNATNAPWHTAVGGVLSAGASLTYTIQATIDEVDGPTDSTVIAIDLDNLTGLTASKLQQITAPITAVRINVTSYTSGSVELQVRQAGVQN